MIKWHKRISYNQNLKILTLKYFNLFFFFQAEDGIRDRDVTGVQTCALPICKLQVDDVVGKNGGINIHITRCVGSHGNLILRGIEPENARAGLNCCTWPGSSGRIVHVIAAYVIYRSTREHRCPIMIRERNVSSFYG